MTAIEHQELKGITLKNLVVTVVSTASIVASVMTTYFGLKSDIQQIKSSQEMQTKINNLRISILEGNVVVLQKEMEQLKPEMFRANGIGLPSGHHNFVTDTLAVGSH